MANSLNLSDLIIDNNDLGEMILTKVQPYYAYADNKRTNTVEGYKYSVVLPEKEYGSLAVKIAGAQLISVERGSHVNVQFDGLVVKPYYDTKGNTYRVTAKAEGISEV